MALPKVVICGFCGKSIRLETEHRLKPGTHVAKIEITAYMCDQCKEKFDGTETPGHTAPGDTMGGGNKKP